MGFPRTLLILVVIVILAATAAAKQHVDIDLAWAPCATCDADGNPVAEAVRYVLLASADDGPETPLAEVAGDTTCTVTIERGTVYRFRVVGYDAADRPSEPGPVSDPVYYKNGNPHQGAVAMDLPANYPNPFNPATWIAYTVPADLATGASLALSVHDVRGALVRRFAVDRAPGPHQVLWDGTDADGTAVASGLYLTRFTCGDRTITRKMTMLK